MKYLLPLLLLTSSCGWFKDKVDGKGEFKVAVTTKPAFELMQPTNQVVWFKAETGFVVGNPAVSQMIDATTPAETTVAQLTAVNQPKLIPYSPMGDVTTVQFDGDDYLTVPNSSDINSVAFNNKTLVMSFRTGADVTTRQYLWEQGNSANGLALYIFDGRLYAAAWRQSGSYISAFLSTPIKANESYTAGWVFDYTLKEFVGYINGSRFAAQTLTTYSMAAHAFDVTLGNSQSTRTEVGTDLRFSVGFRGYLAELNYYKVSLTTAEMLSQHNYLASKWLKFSPKGLDKLAFWYTGKKEEFFVGTPALEKWKDVSNNALDTLSQTAESAKPLVVNAAINGGAALEFNGSQYLELPLSNKIGSEAYLNRSLAIVLKTSDDITSLQYLYEQGNFNSGMSLFMRDKKIHAAVWNGNSHKVFSSDYVEANRTFVAGFLLDGSTQAFSGFLNKRAFATTPIAALQPAELDKPVLGNANGTRSIDGVDVNASGFKGLLSEVISYERALSLAEMQQVHQYLIDSWAIATTAVPLPPEVVAATNAEQQPEIVTQEDFLEEQLGQLEKALEDEYKKVPAIGVDPGAIGGTSQQTPEDLDPDVFDPDEPAKTYPMCDASGKPINGSSGSSGSTTGGTGSSDTIVLSPAVDPVANDGELFERMAELEVFVQAGDDPSLALTTTAEELQRYAKNLEGARTELFLGYLRRFSASTTDVERCRHITKAARLLAEIKNSEVAAGFDSVKQIYDSLSTPFKEAVAKKEVCDSLSLDPTIGMKSYIRNAIATRLESEVINSVFNLEDFVSKQLAVFKGLKDQMEVTLNTEGVLRQKRDIQNIRSNLEMVVGPKAEKVENVIEDFMGIDRKIGSSFDRSQFTLSETGSIANMGPWMQVEGAINCYDANGLSILNDESDLVTKISCLKTVVTKGGKHPVLADLERRIKTNTGIALSDKNYSALDLLSRHNAALDQAQAQGSEAYGEKCSLVSSLYAVDRSDPVTKSSGLALVSAELRDFATSEGVDLTSANKIDVRNKLTELYKSKYNYCLSGLASRLGSSNDSDAIDDRYIKQFSEYVYQYSKDLLVQKNWYTPQ
jgi:hypothetical protein